MPRAGTTRCSGSACWDNPAQRRSGAGAAERRGFFSYVTRSFDGGVLGEECLVNFQPEAGPVERAHVAVPIDDPGILHQFVAEQIRFRDVAFEIAAIA